MPIVVDLSLRPSMERLSSDFFFLNFYCYNNFILFSHYYFSPQWPPPGAVSETPAAAPPAQLPFRYQVVQQTPALDNLKLAGVVQETPSAASSNLPSSSAFATVQQTPSQNANIFPPSQQLSTNPLAVVQQTPMTQQSYFDSYYGVVQSTPTGATPPDTPSRPYSIAPFSFSTPSTFFVPISCIYFLYSFFKLGLVFLFCQCLFSIGLFFFTTNHHLKGGKEVTFSRERHNRVLLSSV